MTVLLVILFAFVWVIVRRLDKLGRALQAYGAGSNPRPPSTPARPIYIPVDADTLYITPQGVPLSLAEGWTSRDVLVTLAEIEALGDGEAEA